MTRANTTPWWRPASRSPPGLLAIALQAIGIQARSWQGWQIPIQTSDAHASARILEIDGAELINRFRERKEVAVIAGFQGIHPATGRITTLGRGGSDTSAVAIAAPFMPTAAISTPTSTASTPPDPRVVPKARRLDKIAFEDMLELASQGAKVLQVRSVGNSAWCTTCRCSSAPVSTARGYRPARHAAGHADLQRGGDHGSHVVTGIAFPRTKPRSPFGQIEDKPGVAAAIFGPLAEANINVDMIVQNVSEDGKTTDLTFTVPASD